MTDTTETRSPHFARERTASTYREIHLPHIFTPWARVLLEIVPVRSGERVLDVATGPGTVAREAATRVGANGRVVGVDISAAMLAIGRVWPPEAGAAPIEYIESTATALPLPDAAFDAAFCQQGLQHMADPLTAAREMRRTLKPGGRVGIALWVKSPFGLFREVVANLGITSDGPSPSDLGKDERELREFLRSAGFADVQVERREHVAILEGGVAQAQELAAATAVNMAMLESSPEQVERINAAITEALQPMLHADGVHLTSIANIASAHV